MLYAMDHIIVNTSQHGFLETKSCATFMIDCNLNVCQPRKVGDSSICGYDKGFWQSIPPWDDK